MKALSADSFLARLLGRLTALILRRPHWFLWPQIVLFLCCVVYALPKPYGHLDFDMNQDDLVGPNQKYHENFLRLQKEFPQQDDLAVVVEGDDGMEVALRSGDGVRTLAPSRLDRVETWWAMTVHKSQGSEFSRAVVSLPDARSPILTRELLYTAITRARHRLTIVATEAAVRAAVDRPLARASGLRARLWPD